MAKQSGLGDNLYVSGTNLSGDTEGFGRIGGGPALDDVTGIDKSAHERIGLAIDGGIDWTSFWNPTGAHPVLATLPRTDVLVTYCRGTALGAHAASLVGKQINYDGTRAADGKYRLAIASQANAYPVDWGRLLTAGRRTDTTATNGTSVDLAASTAFGLQAFLHVFAFTGTSVTVKLQESSDNGVGDAWADVVGGTFTAATGPTSQRIETGRTQTVERYLRAVTTGTFTNAVFTVQVSKNDVQVRF